ncbi:MAG: hypothetical protein ACUVSV_12845 [Armatimonadota bacterium]
MRTLTLILGSCGLLALLASCGGGGGGGGVSDTTAPTISRMAVQPDAPIVPDSKVRVEADVSDDLSGVQNVTVQVTYPDGSTAAHTLSLVSGSTYAVEFNAPSISQPGTATFVVTAKDGAGNTTSPRSEERRLIASPPGAPF